LEQLVADARDSASAEARRPGAAGRRAGRPAGSFLPGRKSTSPPSWRLPVCEDGLFRRS